MASSIYLNVILKCLGQFHHGLYESFVVASWWLSSERFVLVEYKLFTLCQGSRTGLSVTLEARASKIQTQKGFYSTAFI